MSSSYDPPKWGFILCAGVCAVLVILKLAGVISARWALVLAPLWIPAALLIIALSLAIFVIMLLNKQFREDE